MDNIKFRVFVGGRFHYWGFFDEGHGVTFKGLPSSNIEPLSMEEVMRRSQQYTGIEDKNGNEFCVGDIGFDGEKYWEIRFGFGEYYIWWEGKSPKNPDFIDSASGLLSLNNETLLIVGNICENKELVCESK